MSRLPSQRDPGKTRRHERAQGRRDHARGRTRTAGTLPRQPNTVAVPMHHMRSRNHPHLLQRQQRLKGLPVLCPQLGNRRACLLRSASGRVRAVGAVPRPYHGPLAVPLFLRKRSCDAPVLHPVGNHRLQEVPPSQRPNRSRDSRRRGTRRRVRAVGTLSGENHRPVALPLQVQHGHHAHPDQHQRRPCCVRNVLPRHESVTAGHAVRRP